MHSCIRVYNNDDRNVEWRIATEIEGWLEYNSTYRFGCALFVDGEIKQTGYLGLERCEGLAKTIKEELADGRLKPTASSRPRLR